MLITLHYLLRNVLNSLNVHVKYTSYVWYLFFTYSSSYKLQLTKNTRT